MARSIASFIETIGGMSGRNRSSKTASRKIARSTRAILSMLQFLALLEIAASISAECASMPSISSSAKP